VFLPELDVIHAACVQTLSQIRSKIRRIIIVFGFVSRNRVLESSQPVRLTLRISSLPLNLFCVPMAPAQVAPWTNEDCLAARCNTRTVKLPVL